MTDDMERQIAMEQLMHEATQDKAQAYFDEAMDHLDDFDGSVRHALAFFHGALYHDAMMRGWLESKGKGQAFYLTISAYCTLAAERLNLG